MYILYYSQFDIMTFKWGQYAYNFEQFQALFSLLI